MKPGRGKAKGSAFERKIAKALSLWLTKGKDDKQLIRSVLSGGWRGAQQKDGWRQVGDLAPNGPIGEKFRQRYAVECKHRRQINPLVLWRQSTKSDDIAGWWAKLIHDSEAAGVRPMLIFRSNTFPILVMMRFADEQARHVHRAYIGWLDAVIVPFEELIEQDPEIYTE